MDDEAYRREQDSELGPACSPENGFRRMEPFWGEWFLEHRLGSGVYGDVWQIHRGEETAALKVICISKEEIPDERLRLEGFDQNSYHAYMESVIRQAEREYDILRLFDNDPHIMQCEARLLSESADEWMMLIRMERLETLEERFRKVRLTIPEVIRIGIHICKALESCEKKAILHRDLAPGNLFYDARTDAYKLGDFGMAQSTSEVHEMPEKAGTYTAPEVYTDNAYSALSDEYSLGLILYRMLNDFRLPFQPLYPASFTNKERSLVVFRRVSGETPPPPRILLKSPADDPVEITGIGAQLTPATIAIGRRLARVIMRAVQPDPGKRYGSAYDFRAALESLWPSEPICPTSTLPGQNSE